MSQSDDPAAGGKWIKGVAAGQPLHMAAQHILQSRLSAVLHWLPLAAEKSEEDFEYVHQLRVSTRRAVEAVRVFSDLISESACQNLRARLRQVRQTADNARNLDVLRAAFMPCADTSCEDTCRQVADAIASRRRNAQQPIVSLNRELAAEKFNERITDILKEIGSDGGGRSKPTFGRQAPRYLKPVLKQFFKASQADLSDDGALHRLRIRTKKLRYTMEIVEVAFERGFRGKLYRRVSALQDVMGMVNDHAMAKALFGEWLSKTDDTHQKALFRGILLAETKAHEDIRKAFHEIWTPRAARKLRKQFRACRRFP